MHIVGFLKVSSNRVYSDLIVGRVGGSCFGLNRRLNAGKLLCLNGRKRALMWPARKKRKGSVILDDWNLITGINFNH